MAELKGLVTGFLEMGRGGGGMGGGNMGEWGRGREGEGGRAAEVL